MTKILLADDHALVRRGLRQLLEESIAGAVCDEAADGEEILAAARTGGFHLVILDLSLPGRCGLDVLKELRHEHPELPVLVLSMYPEEQFAVRALRAGACGYVDKRTALPDLLKAVEKVLAGGKHVSVSLAERLAGEIGFAPGRPPHELLSDRELQVFQRLSRGRKVTSIAAELGLSVPTVSTYRARILEKLGMRDNSDLVEYAIGNHLFD